MGGGRTASDDEGVGQRPRLGADRDAAQLEHREDVGEGHLELEREAHDIEVGERTRRLERHQRERALTQRSLQVEPGGEAALHEQVGRLVDDRVEDLGPHVAHADVVDVGEAEGEAAVYAAPIFDDRVVLTAHIARRLLDGVDEGGVGVIDLHGSDLSGEGSEAASEGRLSRSPGGRQA